MVQPKKADDKADDVLERVKNEVLDILDELPDEDRGELLQVLLDTYCTSCGYAYDENENPEEHECEDEADDEEGEDCSIDGDDEDDEDDEEPS